NSTSFQADLADRKLDIYGLTGSREVLLGTIDIPDIQSLKEESPQEFRVTHAAGQRLSVVVRLVESFGEPFRREITVTYSETSPLRWVLVSTESLVRRFRRFAHRARGPLTYPSRGGVLLPRVSRPLS